MRKSLETRFWEKIVRVPFSGCWIWTGTVSNGYGYLFVSARTMRSAHLVSFEMHKGKVPDGMELDHLCRVRCCCNPDHLEPVTHKENVNRGMVAEAARALAASITHCPKGHPYSGRNLYMHRARQCKACHREREKKRRDAIAAQRIAVL